MVTISFIACQKSLLKFSLAKNLELIPYGYYEIKFVVNGAKILLS